MLRLVDPTSGSIELDGQDITKLRESQLRPLRQRMQLVFQDPHASLNPAMSVGDAVAHPLVVHGLEDWAGARARAKEILEEVGLTPAARFFDKRPAEMSGGQQQRVVIARAVATRPAFIVADEPVSMLDMSVRAKILELLLRLKEKYDLTLVFITHDLATARFLCDRIAIMYLGKVVEVGDAKDILSRPEHPYSQALLKAVPQPDPVNRRMEAIVRGEVPDAVRPPAGCRFHPRCPVATPICGHTGADLREMADARLAKLSREKRDDLLARLGPPRRKRSAASRAPSGRSRGTPSSAWSAKASASSCASASRSASGCDGGPTGARCGACSTRMSRPNLRARTPKQDCEDAEDCKDG
jgi:oligopeptide/dipeptide ABC transporter ATP-binding protein